MRLAPKTAVIGSQLSYLLCDPDMATLLAAVAQAGRILRPLCRMLAIEAAADLPPGLIAKPPKNTAYDAPALEDREAATQSSRTAYVLRPPWKSPAPA